MRKQVPMKSSRFSLSLKREEGRMAEEKKIRGEGEKENKGGRERMMAEEREEAIPLF